MNLIELSDVGLKIREMMKKKSKISIFLIIYILTWVPLITFSEVLSSKNQESNYKTEYKKWLKHFKIIEPLPKKKIPPNNKLILDLYEEEKLKDLKVNFPSYYDYYNRGKEDYWKKKYFFLLKRLSGVHNIRIENNADLYYRYPLDYNLVVIVYDVVPTKENYKSYCNILINKKKMGETNQALLSQKKIFKLKVKPGTQHMLSVEKFILNETKNEWERIKNLKQPKDKYFTVPSNRIRVIRIIYNSYYEKPNTSHMKYQYLTHFMRKNEEYK